jgi:hypothetical protein
VAPFRRALARDAFEDDDVAVREVSGQLVAHGPVERGPVAHIGRDQLVKCLDQLGLGASTAWQRPMTWRPTNE